MIERFNPRTKEIILDYKRRFEFIRIINDEILAACNILIDSFKNGGKLLICGNGGSNSDADHIVGELLKGFLLKRPVSNTEYMKLKKFGIEGEILAGKLQGSLPAINLGAHNSLITAVINDIGSDEIFAQQVFGYGTDSDVFLGISTSGNSNNIINACMVAQIKGLRTIGLTGVNGGKMNDFFDLVIHAPAYVTPNIQEMHAAIYHLICAVVESELWKE